MAKAEGAAAVAEGNQSGCGWPGIVVQIHLISPTEDAAQEAKNSPCENGSPLPEGLAPMLAPTLGDSGPFETTPDKTAGGGDGVSGGGVKRRLPPSAGDEGSELVGVIGFEPTTSCSQSRHSSQAELHPDEFRELSFGLLWSRETHRQEQSPSSKNLFLYAPGPTRDEVNSRS